jgi:molybdopterin-binding protein
LGAVRQRQALSFKLQEGAHRFCLQLVACRLQLISTPGEINMTIKAINVRNQFKGSIKEIVLGDVLSEIDVQTASGIVTSVITTRSVKELELVVGSEVIAFVKSTEVSIAKL